MHLNFRVAVTLTLTLTLLACSPKPAPQAEQTQASSEVPSSTAASATNALVGKIWRISASPAPAPGSIFVFLPNGTLLETSCVETYRVAQWTRDPVAAQNIRVIEDGRLAFTAVIAATTDHTIKLNQTLSAGSKETRELILTALEGESVCPDLPK
jgi:hypothetical protein